MSDFARNLDTYNDGYEDEPDEEEQDDYPTETTEPPEDENPF